MTLRRSRSSLLVLVLAALTIAPAVLAMRADAPDAAGSTPQASPDPIGQLPPGDCDHPRADAWLRRGGDAVCGDLDFANFSNGVGFRGWLLSSRADGKLTFHNATLSSDVCMANDVTCAGQGPVGPQGPPGPQGPRGDAAPVTCAASAWLSAVDASGNATCAGIPPSSLSLSGPEIYGLLPIGLGGTGAADAAGARANLGAAASGSNHDITSMNGLAGLTITVPDGPEPYAIRFLGQGQCGTCTNGAAISHPAANTLSLVTEGKDRIFVQNNGAVGVGTTTPAGILDVNGDAYVRGNLSANAMSIPAGPVASTTDVNNAVAQEAATRQAVDAQINASIQSGNNDLAPRVASLEGYVNNGSYAGRSVDVTGDVNASLLHAAQFTTTEGGGIVTPAGAWAEQVYNDTTYHFGSQQWRAHDNSVLATLTSTGALGVGTSVPDGRLHVNGGRVVVTGAGGGTNSGQIRIDSGNGTDPIYLDAPENGGFLLQAGLATRLAVDPAGNLGVGTSAPGRVFDVRSHAGTAFRVEDDSTSGNAVLEIRSDHNNQRAINFENSQGGPDSQVSSWGGAGNENLSIRTFGNIYFNTSSANGGYGTTQLAIASSGNVGIGTTTPQEALDVMGKLRITGPNGEGDIMRPDDAGIGLAVANNGDHFLGPAYFHNALGSVINDEINDTGALGIGTTSPQAKLDVNGGVRVGGDAAASCTTANLGELRFVADPNGQNDSMQVCARAAGSPAWRTVTLT